MKTFLGVVLLLTVLLAVTGTVFAESDPGGGGDGPHVADTVKVR